MRKSAPIQLTVQFPETGAGRQELARRVSEVQGDFVCSTIHKQNCPARQRVELLQAVIDAVRGIDCAPDGSEPAGQTPENPL